MVSMGECGIILSTGESAIEGGKSIGARGSIGSVGCVRGDTGTAVGGGNAGAIVYVANDKDPNVGVGDGGRLVDMEG